MYDFGVDQGLSIIKKTLFEPSHCCVSKLAYVNGFGIKSD